VHTFTHLDPAPKALMHGVSLVQAVDPHVTNDGHAHGPLKAYFTPFNASTTAKMSNTLILAFNSGRLG